MPTLRHAAAMLRDAVTPEGRLALAHLLSFHGETLELDAASRRSVGLGDEVARATLVAGEGCLRALLIEGAAHCEARALLTQVASSLHRRDPAVQWLVVGAATGGTQVFLGTWSPGSRGPRPVALVVQPQALVASDAETLLSLASASTGDDILVHARWCELLGRSALSQRFYRILEERVRELAASLTGVPADARAELALLHVSRLLFLSFLETKGWLNGDRAFLSHQYDACMATGGHFHQRVLLPLFFGTLNTRIRQRAAVARAFGAVPFLNGGLFARTSVERRHSRARFSDEAFGALFSDLLGAFRFTARESSTAWMEASVDPEMLGRAFESLMAGHERRTSGAFYTPQELVEHVVTRGLEVALGGRTLCEGEVAAALRGDALSAYAAAALREALETFTVIDPACGSGAFLVHLLERLAALHQRAGDRRDVATIRREVLGRAIHGVDINPMAVWLCELRLWLSVVIESEETRAAAVPPLPNLDCNIRVGDALSGEGFTAATSVVGPPAVLARLHGRYVRASGPAKASLRKALGREEKRRAVAAIDRELVAIAGERRERVLARRSADLFGDRARPTAADRAAMRASRMRATALRRVRRRISDGGALPFSFPSHFGAIHARGGFRLVIGNPPWVRVHNIPAADRAALRSRFSVYRHAAWEAGARGGRASSGFASQVDLASMFVERGADLTAAGGCIALLLPSKLWRSLAGGGLRAFVSASLTLRGLDDWSEAPSLFNAAVYPSVLVAQRGRVHASDVVAEVHRSNTTARWRTPADELRLQPDDGASPLLLLPPPVRAAFDRLREDGTPLTTVFGHPMLGVKCGHNDAFLVSCLGEHGDDVTVARHERRGVLRRASLRPLLRGEAVTPWTVARGSDAILWTHDDSGRPLPELDAHAARWLAPWKCQLASRSDLHNARTWWSLFRTEGARDTTSRVVWSDFGRRPRATVLPAGNATVPLNTCYVLPCEDHLDAMALCALLNSPVAAAWLNAIAEPARGGWHRYLAWTISLLPIPRCWESARPPLARVTELALVGELPSEAELMRVACEAYDVPVSCIEPLLAWSCIPPMH